MSRLGGRAQVAARTCHRILFCRESRACPAARRWTTSCIAPRSPLPLLVMRARARARARALAKAASLIISTCDSGALASWSCLQTRNLAKGVGQERLWLQSMMGILGDFVIVVFMKQVWSSLVQLGVRKMDFVGYFDGTYFSGNCGRHDWRWGFFGIRWIVFMKRVYWDVYSVSIVRWISVSFWFSEFYWLMMGILCKLFSCIYEAGVEFIITIVCLEDRFFVLFWWGIF